MCFDRLEETPMILSFRLSSAVAAIAAAAGAAHADLPRFVDPPPRYQFQAGQELTYKETSSFKHGQGDNAGSLDDNSEWTVRVLRGNADGSFRLVVRRQNTVAQTIGTKKISDGPLPTQFTYADVFP